MKQAKPFDAVPTIYASMINLNPFRFFRRIRQLVKEEVRRSEFETCLVCGSKAAYLDTVDFNKSCEELRGKRLPPSGKSIEYRLCDHCGFCFAPEFRTWSFEEFERLIYNSDYESIDPDYKFIRPNGNAHFLAQQFGTHSNQIRHLDYGGGSGLLSKTLCQSGWTSNSYDPFVDHDKNPDELGSYDLVTAFEVCEHVPDPVHLFDTLKKLCKPNGLILFSTMLSDGEIARSKKLEWWYASPRNGHISLYSQQSLKLLASQRGLKLVSFNSNLHAAFSSVPKWAEQLIRVPDNSPPTNLSAEMQAEAAKNRGNALLGLGDFPGAVACFQEALNIFPSYAEAKVNLGVAFRLSGRLQESKENLLDAIALKPALWQGHFQLGVALHELGQYQQAVDSYGKSIELNDRNPESFWRLGLALVMLEKWTEAISAFGSANLSDQDLPEVHESLGLALLRTSQFKDALHHFQIALSVNKTASLHFLIGTIQDEFLMWSEAEASYRSALALADGDPMVHFRLSFLLLLKGDYIDGFAHYEQRLKLTEKDEWLGPIAPVRDMIACLGTDQYWNGQDIAGTSIVLFTEQGLGDVLMMLRYVPLLKTLKHAARVCVVCDENLARIFQSCPEVDEVRMSSTVTHRTDFDFYCTTMSLPHLFRTELNSIPASPYMAVPEQQRSKWMERVSSLDGFKVGIAWSGNNSFSWDVIRSITLDRLGPLFSIPGIVWINLQKGQAADQLKQADLPIHDWMDESNDIMDTTALIDCLDLVITVDTSIVHMAGAIGRPTWLLNRFETDWRWGLEGEDSPWYSSVRVLRQTTRNDWDSVIEKVATDLPLMICKDKTKLMKE